MNGENKSQLDFYYNYCVNGAYGPLWTDGFIGLYYKKAGTSIYLNTIDKSSLILMKKKDKKIYKS